MQNKSITVIQNKDVRHSLQESMEIPGAKCSLIAIIDQNDVIHLRTVVEDVVLAIGMVEAIKAQLIASLWEEDA